MRRLYAPAALVFAVLTFVLCFACAYTPAWGALSLAVVRALEPHTLGAVALLAGMATWFAPMLICATLAGVLAHKAA